MPDTWYIEEYIKKGRSQEDIATELNCSITRLRRHLYAQKLYRFNCKSTKQYPFTESDLKRLYIDEKYTKRQIADIYGYSQDQINRALKKYNLSRPKAAISYMYYKIPEHLATALNVPSEGVSIRQPE